jgi:hypothetical protein
MATVIGKVGLTALAALVVPVALDLAEGWLVDLVAELDAVDALDVEVLDLDTEAVTAAAELLEETPLKVDKPEPSALELFTDFEPT